MTVRDLSQNFSDKEIDDFTKAQRIAGAFALNAIYQYLNEVDVEAGFGVPERIGGRSYSYFSTVYTNIQLNYAPDTHDRLRQKEACLAAVEAIRKFVDGYQEGGDASMEYAYERFSMKINVIDRVLGGETIKEIVADFETYPHLIEGKATQMPAHPSWLSLKSTHEYRECLRRCLRPLNYTYV